MILRPYQTDLLLRLRSEFKTGARAVLVCLATGGGKTVLAAEIIRSAAERGNRTLFMVHRRELIDQAVERLAAFGVTAGQIIANRREHRDRPVQVASVQTLIRRDFPEADLVFIDEAHHAAAKTYRDILAKYQGKWIIGLTATPSRLDGRPLGDVFDRLLVGITPKQLCDAGVLHDPVIYSHPSRINVDGLKIRAGDYDQAALGERAADTGLVGDIVTHWKEFECSRTVAFAVNVVHSRMIVDRFCSEGVAAEHLDGETPMLARAAILARLRSGETQIVSNCMVLGEGYDLPELDTAIIARPTASRSLWMQMCGRIMRAAPGKTGAIVLDHAGNAERHGTMTEDMVWSLDGRAKRAAVASPRICPECFCANEPGAKECLECGYVWPVQERESDLVERDGKLERFSPVDRREWYTKQVAYASAYSKRLGSARHAYKQRFGVWPKLAEIEQANYRCPHHLFEKTEHGYRCNYCLRYDRGRDQISYPARGGLAP